MSRGKLARRFRRHFRLFSRTRSTKTFEKLEQRWLFSTTPIPAPIVLDEVPHVVWAPDTPQQVVDEWEGEFAALGAEINDVDANRWTRTATNGSGLVQGHPSTITWSVVPDGTSISGFSGEPAAPSDLRTRLDTLYGSMSSWLPVFQQVFDRWEAVSGIDFVYEPSDDGARLSSTNNGVVGRRGDIRIGGHFIDGNGSVLAYNFFPNVGDMVIDTADNFFSSLASNSLHLRNVVAHEVGHGLGLPHSLPVVGAKLMEPFINLSFDGPQHDDILRMNRGYGDRLEGNDTSATAYGLGGLTSELVTVSEVSIDDDSDVDYYSFSVDASSVVDFSLSPVGSVYTVGLEGGSNETFDSRAQSNLSLAVLAANGTTIVRSVNDAGLGGSESIVDLSLAAGQYYVRVTGVQDAAQLYALTVDADIVQPPAPPVLSAIGDQTIQASQDLLQLTLVASDANNDPLTFSAVAQSVEYQVDQALGLASLGGNEYFNWGGRNEKWLVDKSNAWYYITPDGKLYRWLGGSLAADPLVEQVSTAAYANTALLHNAQPNGAAASLSVNGSTLTINPNDGFSGKFYVTATVSDGAQTDSESFWVVVQPGSTDTTAPVVTSRTPANGATISASTTAIDVTFSEAVTGVDATDLVLTGTGAANAVKSAPTNVGGNTWRFAVSNLQNGQVNVSLAPDANDIEDAAGNDLAATSWGFAVNLTTAQAPPVLSSIGEQTMPSSQDVMQLNLVASDPNNDPLTFTATAQSVEYHVDQNLGLNGIGGNEYLNWGGRNEKWLTDRTNAWHYITPDGKLYRWLGGSLSADPLVEQLSTAAYANTALLYNALANNGPALLTIDGSTLTINPHVGFRGKFYVSATVSDGRGGTDSKQFAVVVT